MINSMSWLFGLTLLLTTHKLSASMKAPIERQGSLQCIAGSTDADCCKTKKCAEGEGDCDSDSECADGLVCGTNNCGAGFPNSDYDCCVKPGSLQCIAGSTKADCCSVKGQCGEGEGDCDSDSECVNGLVCGTDNCGAGFPSSDYDCCVKPGSLECLAGSATANCCTVKGQCAEGEGDCDSDSECADGLFCGNDNCGAGFTDIYYDCCVKPDPSCELKNNTLIVEGSIPASTVGECQAKCQDDNNCQFFTYNEASKGCGLRNFVPGGRSFSLGNISGLKNESPTAWSQISNSVYVGKSLTVNTAEECRIVCLADDDCNAMIFNALLNQCSLNYGEGPFREIPLGPNDFGISSCQKQ